MTIKEFVKEMYNRLRYPICCDTIHGIISIHGGDIELVDTLENNFAMETEWFLSTQMDGTCLLFLNDSKIEVEGSFDKWEFSLVLLELKMVRTFIAYIIPRFSYRMMFVLDELTDLAIDANDYQALVTILETDWNSIITEFIELNPSYHQYRNKMRYVPLNERFDDYYKFLEKASDHYSSYCITELLRYKHEWSKDELKKYKELYL